MNLFKSSLYWLLYWLRFYTVLLGLAHRHDRPHGLWHPPPVGEIMSQPRDMYVDRSSRPEAGCTSTRCTKKIKCVHAQRGRESTHSLANRSRLYASLLQEPGNYFESTSRDKLFYLLPE